MMRRRTAAIATVLALVVGLAGLISGASAERVQIGPLVVVTGGDFTPHRLPRIHFAPISFWGHAEISTVKGNPPPALTHVMLAFDRDGKLTTAGLPVCQPSSIENATPMQARQRCHGAIVGTGHAAAVVTMPGRTAVKVESPLTLFNGPPQGGNPTVLAHAQTTYPELETYVVVATIEKRPGAYGYRTSFDVPAIAHGHGVLTHVDARIGKRFQAEGKQRSYVSARCSHGILRARGQFYFADGNELSGELFRPCQAIG